MTQKQDSSRIGRGAEQLPRESDSRSLEWLGEELLGHQAGIQIDYLYDHGWQVVLTNPGGHLYVHACEGDEKWPGERGPTLLDTIVKAIDQAKAEGWW